ncbi:MAG: hypothetical protein K0Q50_68 [Vampirovibrio sp.]|jgi:hypothetical protein|nr:hypothetical protein [Vampirovibrio sp.]
MSVKTPVGQSMTEYVVIGASVLVVSMGGLLLLGSTLNQQFSNMVASRPLHGPMVVAVGKAPSVPVAVSPAVLGSKKIKLSDNTEVVLNHVGENLKKTVETAGANGATERMLADLQSLTQQLVTSGKITEAQGNDLYALANKGYQIAALERQIEDVANAARSDRSFLNTRIEYNGKQYTVEEAGELLGFASGVDPAKNIQRNPEYLLSLTDANSETKAFIQQYNKVMQNGSMEDPAVKGIVSQLSSNITYLTDIVVDVVWSIQNSDLSVSQTQSHLVSLSTVFDSNGICSAGKGNSKNLKCN